MNLDEDVREIVDFNVMLGRELIHHGILCDGKVVAVSQDYDASKLGELRSKARQLLLDKVGDGELKRLDWPKGCGGRYGFA